MKINKKLSLVIPALGIFLALFSPAYGVGEEGGSTPCDGMSQPAAPVVNNGKKDYDDTFTDSCIPTASNPTFTPLCCWDLSDGRCKQWSWRYMCCENGSTHWWGIDYKSETFDATYTCGWYASNAGQCEN